MTKSLLYGLGVLASILLLTASLLGWIANSWQEVATLISGCWCIWLVVKEHIWNWPIGLVTSTFSAYVLYEARFFADSILNVLYFILGLFGWYWWLHGGKNRAEVAISRIGKGEAAALLMAAALTTFVWSRVLIHYNGAAPVIDALTTSTSLAAQYMTTKKYLESWVVWIVVDLIYVPLFFWRGLDLLAILYFIYLILAVAGHFEWLDRYRQVGAMN